MSLTPKQRAFVRQYCVDRSGKQAAIRSGYSPRTAEVQGSRLLRNAKVRAEVDKHIAEQFAALDISAERILRELSLLAFANVADFAELGFKYCDKIRALELLFKYQMLFTERHQLLSPPEEFDVSGLSDQELSTFKDLVALCLISSSDLHVNQIN